VPAFFTSAFFDFPKERIEHMIWLHIIFAYCFYCIAGPPKPLKPQINFLLAGLSIFACICGLYRFLGELHTRRMYDNKAQNNIPGVINEANKAESFIYHLDPTSVPLKWYKGNAYASQGNFALAEKTFAEALKESPYNRNVLNDLASACVNTGNASGAIEYYTKAARISPRFDDPKLNLAAFYIKQENFSAADSCLKSLFHDSKRRTQYQNMVDAFAPDKNHRN
jgi:tetratricopeptide (TPR) repeat protein